MRIREGCPAGIYIACAVASCVRALGDDPTKRFSGRADDYARYRPRYPKALYDHLFASGMLREGSAVADVGSGTGIFSKPLLERGVTVYCIEPNQEMRCQAEKDLAGCAGFVSMDGRAEVTGLPDASVDLVVAAQAYHWFDLEAARAEFGRILRPGGQLCIVYNERADKADAFSSGYEGFIARHTKKDKASREKDRDPIEFFPARGCMVCEFENSQELDQEGLLGRTFSVSYMPGRGEPGHDAVAREVSALFDEHQRNGKVVLLYITRMFCGRLG